MLEAVRNGDIHPMHFVLGFYCLVIFVCCLMINLIMAKTKGYGWKKAVIVACIPVVNMVFSLIYLGLPKKDKE
ncbi:hypothetical protein EIK76_06505 [Rheinheimera mesophila]|uniref:Uncharacterized protein n=1 Tax=Rheinheimera mesophila TaxID=1547515 RepID=A0A3P3QTP9_9GAMM|nr:hypothetical protein [Rheinheimera mesophila]RRJ23703.1 hypothetical protein EIK76_06505 [Rheinheimera mesophila]